MNRILVYLNDSEIAALRRVAGDERRPTRDQAAHIIARELARLGMMNPGDHRAAQPEGEGSHATTAQN